MNRLVILAAGRVERPAELCPLLCKSDFFVAVDGGLKLAKEMAISPHLAVGDFDSYTAALPAVAQVIRLPRKKDCTDTLAAAEWGIAHGYQDFLLLGCTGGRLDHTLANLAVLSYLREHGAQACIADEYTRVQLLLPGKSVIPYRPEWKVSLLPYGGAAEGVTIQNVAYPLFRATLTTDNPLGISNEFLDGDALLSFEKGMLLLFFSKD